MRTDNLDVATAGAEASLNGSDRACVPGPRTGVGIVDGSGR